MDERGQGPAALVAVLFVIGICTVALGLGALPTPIGESGGDSPTAESQLDRAIDDAAGDRLEQEGVGGVAGETQIGTVRSYRNPSEEVQFVVDSTEPAYWRTAAYDVYTGQGWYRSTEQSPFPMDEPAGDKRAPQIQAEVTLQTSTSRVPAPWRPVSVTTDDDYSFRYTGQGGLESERRIEPGTEVTVEGVPPSTDPETLQSAGTRYSEPIESRYTALPEDTPDSVSERAAEITADAETPYESAVAVRDWLRANRGYTLDVPPPESDVADELLTERDAAHCAYFATTMAAMLRAEGIPTRYAVGYTSGDRAENGSYVVRDAHAHAWVEVYFPDVGWVPFEPTPSSERSQAVAEALDGIDDDDYGGAGSFDPTPSDEENRTFDPPEEHNDSKGPDDQDNETEPEPPDGPGNGQENGTDDQPGGDEAQLSIELAADPVPGWPLALDVRSSEGDAPGATVFFNGEPIGEVSSARVVRGTVPYTDTLTITVRHPDTPTSADPDGERTVSVPTEIDVSAPGTATPNGTVEVEAILEGIPVEDATVTVDGEAVGTTAVNGTAEVSMPTSPNETVTIGVERGDASGSTDVRVQPVDLTVEEPTVLLPGRDVTVGVTANGSPVDGINVSLGGQTVRTGPDGTATMEAPTALSTTIAVEGKSTPETTITPLANLGMLVLVGLGALLVAVLSIGRQRWDRFAPLAWLIDAGREFTRYAEWVTEHASDALDRVHSTLGAVLGALSRWRDRRRPLPRIDRGSPRDAVRAAWTGLLIVVPGDHTTDTPRSIADRAIAYGLPERHAERILAAYRRVRYGGQSPSEAQAEQLVEARDALQDQRRDSG